MATTRSDDAAVHAFGMSVSSPWFQLLLWLNFLRFLFSVKFRKAQNDATASKRGDQHFVSVDRVVPDHVYWYQARFIQAPIESVTQSRISRDGPCVAKKQNESKIGILAAVAITFELQVWLGESLSFKKQFLAML